MATPERHPVPETWTTRFTHTYFAREEQENSDEISNLLRRFWEIENYGTSTEFHPLSTDEKASLEKLEESIRYVDGRYQVAIPWKDDEPALPNNYERALRRLLNTEKRLLKNPEIGEAYANYINEGLHPQIGPHREEPSKEVVLASLPGCKARPNNNKDSHHIGCFRQV